MTNAQLVDLVLEERQRMAKKRPGVPYYMLNVQHPAVAVMYAKWRAEQGPHGCPPGDRERTLFELDMMAPAARRLLEDHFDLVLRLRQEAAKAQKGEYK